MPELPEVETIKKGLEKYVVGHKIEDIQILHPKPFQGDTKDAIGSKITSVKRIGKGLILNLSNGKSLAIHIKMTGQLVFRDNYTAGIPVSPKVKSVPNKYTHVIFHLDKGATLFYNDMRRFGWIKVLPTFEVSKLPFFNSMGPEPLKDLSFELFEKIISNKKTNIKQLIMDQSKIGGVGNIYANDALFEAKINPRRTSGSLDEMEIKHLFDSLCKVLKKGIKAGGSSERSYVDVLGQEGSYQKLSIVYGKKGKQCPRGDGGIIKRITLGGRGTFYCDRCQV